MEDERSCSARWPRYAIYVYSTVSVLVGGGLVGVGVFLLKSENSLKTLYTTVLSSGQYDDFSLLLFIQLSSLIIGACMILASVSLGVCGAYKMNRSCMAAYVTVVIFGFIVLAAVGLTAVAHEPAFKEDILAKSAEISDDTKTLEHYTRLIMICTLGLAGFQLLGVILTCCLQKAIEDISKQ